MQIEQKIEYVTLKQLTNVLKEVNRPIPATIVALSVVKMNKIGNPYHGKITKKQKANVFIKFDYQNSINKARIKESKEADFISKPRVWGIHVENTPLIEHKNEFYLEARFLNYGPKVEYFIDSINPIKKSEFSNYLPTVKECSGRQELDDSVIMRDFKLSGILEITMNGIKYIRSDV
jgi:hypothetical protein